MTVESTLTLRYTISNNGGVHYPIPMRIQTKDDITIDLIETGTTTTLDPAKYSVSAITESSFLLTVVQTGDIPVAPDSAEVRLMWPLERTVDYPSGTISSTEFNANGDSEVIGTMARIQESTQLFLALNPYDSRWANTGVDRYPTADYDSGKDLAITMKWGDQPKWSELATGEDLSALQAEVDTNTAGIATNGASIATNVTSIAANLASIATNTTSITSNANSIASATAGVATNVTSIAANTSDISTNTSAIVTVAARVTENESVLNSYSFPTANNLFGVTSGIHPLGVHPELAMKAMGLLSGQDVPFYSSELHHSGANYISTVDITVSPPTFSNVQADLNDLLEEIVTLKARLDALEAQ
jgi:hypothetical protein